MDFSVLPAPILKMWYCLTAILSGSRISKRANRTSRGDSYSSSSSRTSAAASISITVAKFCSSGGASCMRYRTKACRSAVSDLVQKGSELCAPGGVVD